MHRITASDRRDEWFSQITVTGTEIVTHIYFLTLWLWDLHICGLNFYTSYNSYDFLYFMDQGVFSVSYAFSVTASL